MKRIVFVVVVLLTVSVWVNVGYALSSRLLKDGGFGNADNAGIYTIDYYNGGIFVGVNNPTTGCEVFRSLDGLSYTQVNNDGFDGDTNNTLIHSMLADHDLGFLFAGTWNSATGCEVWTSSNGTTWTQSNADGFGNALNYEVPAMADNDGYIYAGVYNPVGGCSLWRTDDGTSWTAVVGPGALHGQGFGDAANGGIRMLVGYNDYLYAGIYRQTVTGTEIWRSADGEVWEQVVGDASGVDSGFGDANNRSIDSAAKFKNPLYVGTRNETTGGEIWRRNQDATWTQVNTDGFGSADNWSIRSLVVHGEYLYAGTANPSGCQMWRSSGGSTWTQVVSGGFGNTANDELYVMASMGEFLLSGTVVSGTDGCELWRSTDDTTWYFAEGTTREGYEVWLTVQNPNATAATVDFTFMKTGGSTVSYEGINIDATKRYTLNPASLAGMSNTDFSTKIVSTNGVGIVAERPMYIGESRAAGHNTIGSTVTSDMWYFAEGTTAYGFQPWLTVLNPNSFAVDVNFTFMKTDGTTVETTAEIESTRRFTLDPASVAGLSSADFATMIEIDEDGVGVVAERPMYWNSNAAAHNTIGALMPSLVWYFAEGSTRDADNFEVWLTVQNPNDNTAQIAMTFMETDGTTVQKTAEVEGTKRYTLDVATVEGLSSADFATKVEATNGVTVVAERPMYWGENRAAGHNTIGTTVPAQVWYFAEGSTRDDEYNAEVWLTVQNPGTATAEITMTFMKTDGTTVQKTAEVEGTKRYTLDVASVEGLSSADFATKIESTNNIDVVAERPMYWSDRTAGHNSIGSLQ